MTDNTHTQRQATQDTDCIPTGWVWCCELEENLTEDTTQTVVLMCGSREAATQAGYNANILPDMCCKHIGLYHEDTIRNGHYTLHSTPYRFYDVR